MRTFHVVLVLSLLPALASCATGPVDFEAPPRSTTADPLRVRVEATGLEGVGAIDSIGRRQVLISARSALVGLLGETSHFRVVDPSAYRVNDVSIDEARAQARGEQKKQEKSWWDSLFGSSEPKEPKRRLPDPPGTPKPTTAALAAQDTVEAEGFPYRLRVNVDYLELQTGRQRRKFESVEDGRQQARNFPQQPIDGVEERFAHVAVRTTVVFEFVDPETGLIRTISSARGVENWNAPAFFTGRSAGSNTAIIYTTLESSIARALKEMLSSPKITMVESELRRVDQDSRRDLIEKYRRASAEHDASVE